MKRLLLMGVLVVAVVSATGAGASTPGADVRLSNDCLVPPFSDPGPGYLVPPGCGAGTTVGGYVSAYTIGTGVPVTDDEVIAECSVAHGRQNEPAVAVDPRDTDVLIGSSNDYCGTYAGTAGDPQAIGPIWLGYYRSEDSGGNFLSSLVPGYPGDTSPYAAQAHVRTASAGDPVIAWDAHGRVFMGAESSDDPAGSRKTFGDVWVAVFDNPAGPGGDTKNDGQRFVRSEIVATGSSAPNLLGVFHDKTAIEVDRTGGPCDGNVYFAWSRFNGNGSNAVYLARSTNHGVSWSAPQRITESVQSLQDPDIAVTGNGHVYVTYHYDKARGKRQDAIGINKSSTCGATFAPTREVLTYTEWGMSDLSDPEPSPLPQAAPDDPGSEEGEEEAPASTSRDCGDFTNHCAAGYTFFRGSTQVRSTADQYDPAHEWVYIVYDPSKEPDDGGAFVPTGTTYGSAGLGVGSQAAVYFTRYDGATGTTSEPVLVDPEPFAAGGHQVFPDISADTPRTATQTNTILHTIWWDSRNDACYSPTRPIGNCADRSTVPSLDAFASRSEDNGGSWDAPTRLSDVTSNPNWEQFDNRTVPFAGDYLWVTSLGDYSFGTWTDWRNTRQGADPREATGDEDGASADVYQCRNVLTSTGKKGVIIKSWSSDQCPHSGGLDQDIFGDHTP